MRWVGLTGGIASGKSTVGKILEREGIPVVDADHLARKAVEKGQPAYEEIVQAFGPEILQEDGELDRPKLGSIVFPDRAKLEKLEKMVHPHVRQLAMEEKQKLIASGAEVAVYMVPLLFEKGSGEDFDEVIVVASDPENQLKRIRDRDGLSDEEATDRIASQMSVEEKIALADDVIQNNGTLEELEEAVLQIIQDL